MSRHLAGIGDSEILQRKVPQNVRYKDIEARVDTGASSSRYERHIEEMQSNYRYRKNELFKRMKVTTFAQLVLQVANISMQDDDASISDLASARSEATSIATLNGNHAGEEMNEERLDANGDEEDSLSPRSTLQSVIKGVGEADMSPNGGKNDDEIPQTPYLSKPYPNCPYLLLDVRDKDEFEKCHITGAVNFPIAMLSRTMNNFSRQILEFKNSLGRIIILYDEDERLATTAATTMVERGFDNVFILSGGLKVVGQKIPEGLVNGTLPPSCVPAYIIKRLKNNRSFTERQQRAANAFPNIQRFSPEDLDKISHYLDESLIPNDTGSRLSRQSKASYRSNVSKASSVASSGYSSSSRRPWK